MPVHGPTNKTPDYTEVARPQEDTEKASETTLKAFQESLAYAKIAFTPEVEQFLHAALPTVGVKKFNNLIDELGFGRIPQTVFQEIGELTGLTPPTLQPS